MKLTKKKTILLATVGAISIFAITMIIRNGNKEATVAVSSPQHGDLAQVITVSGTIDANESQVDTLNNMQKISKIHFNEGDSVGVGDVILEYDKSDIIYQLDKAKINLKLLKLQLQKMQDSLSTTDKEAAANAVSQAELNLKTIQGTFDQVKRNHENNILLYDQGFLAKEEFLASEKNLADITSQLDLAKIALSNASGNYTSFEKNASFQITNQKEQIAMLELDIAKLTKGLSDTTIKSSIVGTVVNNDGKVNQYPATPSFVKILDLSTYKINVNISQYDAGNVALGQKATVTIKGVADEFEGVVSKVGRIAEGAAGQEAKVNVEITLVNPNDSIIVGFEADVDLITAEQANALYVPYDTIRQEDDKNYVFVVKDSAGVSILEKRYVELGIETDFDVQILSGLSEADIYVVNPSDNLKDGDSVKIAGGK